MKRALVFIAMILLAGGILFEEKHRAETLKNHLPPVVLRDPSAAPETDNYTSFSDQVDLWGNPWAKPGDAGSSYAGLASQTNLPPTSFDQFQSKLDYNTQPVMTVQDREFNYALFEAGGFTLFLDLRPTYPNPQALMPSHVDAAIGGSFSF
jgi:hypothetical protein